MNDPTAMIAEAMRKLKEASAPSEGARVVPRASDTSAQSFGNNPTQKVMATPGETYVPPEIAQKPGVMSLLERINGSSERTGDPTQHLSSLYESLAKPIKALSLAMGIWGGMAMASPMDVITGDASPLEQAISMAEGVKGLRRDREETDTAEENRYGGNFAVSRKFGGPVEPTTGTTGEDSESTMMDPGGFVVNANASAEPNNKEVLTDLLMGQSPFLWMEHGGKTDGKNEPQSFNFDSLPSMDAESRKFWEEHFAEKGESLDETPSLYGQESAAGSNAESSSLFEKMPQDDNKQSLFVDNTMPTDQAAQYVPFEDSQGLEPSSGTSGTSGFDYSKLSTLIAQAQRVHNSFGNMQSNTGGLASKAFGWESAPDFHQALYGSPPEQPKQSGGMGGVDMDQIKQLGMVAAMIVAPELAIPAMAGGGEAGMLGEMLGGEAGAASKVGGEGLFGGMGGQLNQLFGMMSNAQGTGGEGDIGTLVKAVMDLVNILKGQGSNDQPVSDPAGPMKNVQPGRKVQGADPYTIMRNRGL